MGFERGSCGTAGLLLPKARTPPASCSFPPLPPCLLSTVSPDGSSQTLSPQAPFIPRSVILPFKSRPEAVSCVLKVFTFHQLLSALLHFRVLTLACVCSPGLLGSNRSLSWSQEASWSPPLPPQRAQMLASSTVSSKLPSLGQLPLDVHHLPFCAEFNPCKSTGLQARAFPINSDASEEGWSGLFLLAV